MKVDKSTLLKVAHLSRLHVQDSEEELLLENMNRIIGWMDKLNELDTNGVEPLCHMTESTNVMREDRVKGQLTQEEALENAPLHDNTFFRVPKVVG